MGALLAREGARRAALVVVIVALGAPACGPSSVTLPVPPTELQTAAVEYDLPPGTVPPRAMAQITELQQRLDVISRTQLGELVTDALVSLRERAVGNGVETDPAVAPNVNHFSLRGSVMIERVCRGWDDASTTPDAANGTIELTAVIDASRLARVVWGTAAICRGRIDVANAAPIHAFLDGTLAVYLEGPLPTSISDASFIVGWSGTLGTEQAQGTTSFDFRIAFPQLEVRLPAADGNIIGSIGANGVALRGSNGTFGCSLETLTCGAADTARGTDP